MNRRPRSTGRLLRAIAGLLVIVTPLSFVTPAVGAPPLRLEILSGRPDTVSGGDALVQVGVPAGVRADEVRVTLNGTDVTSAFALGNDALIGLVGGMRSGSNTLRADAVGRPGSRLDVRNHPRQGPVFSGPHQQPFVCETARFTVPVIGGTLGEPLDADCTVAPRVDYFYRTTADAWKAWPAGATSYPSDLARTATDVPFVVRMETGSANRAVVQTSMLHDPLSDAPPSPVTRSAGWNGRAIFTLGGGCAGGWYRSGSTTGGVTDPVLLGQGYALMSSSLNVFGQNCNDLTAAESAMMTKEMFVEHYGKPLYTVGFGCSGGSYQAHQITDNYPGIFDGIIVGCSFPDVAFGTVTFISDAWLLNEYFSSDASVPWTQEQKRLVSGFATYATLPSMAVSAGRIDPRRNCDIVPLPQRYDPVTSPRGVRCDVYDHALNVYGTDPATGFARRPLDNVGVQYGLRALESGAIDVDQFLDLNERIGGFDQDANIVAHRTVADPAAVSTAYRTGRLTNGGGGLANVPIIDYRAYYDTQSWGDIHVRYHTSSMRARLLKANGTTANHVSLLEDARYGLFNTASPLLQHAITSMDKWLTALTADTSSRPPIDKIAATRPSTLQEGCQTPDGFLAQPLDRNPTSRCEQLYPSASFPREVAGADVAADIIKCHLRTPARTDYANVTWTDPQWTRLRTIFPAGVCDHTKPGMAQQPLAGTWLRFGAVSPK
ncbi:hypothetical protein EV643_102282 [Kribbella sp. VKM Ac-2527]|uniref:DUF6351 domain-containing protein n=1 Tax=Kribbella caucasensis TaxID=2512215 RepID=A0A4R6KM18_9ACTN|nr:DUF6351 family protein [Kribbella sp. VKM Ac-2527]TDO52443.1 hypothetical protein EV643_102282 [Kribbella sp. VKM Ac-2527]